jgi:Raf kinase inhibitor-like YbhB/YbcL family protein
MRKKFWAVKSKVAFVAGALLCAAAAQAQMAVTSTAFVNGATIPHAYTYNMAPQCSGSNQSPPLEVAGIPAGAQTLAIVMRDTTVPWLHWKAWDIPVGGATVTLPADAAATLPAGTQAMNDFPSYGYGGACPPAGGTHNYVFTVYALNVAAGGGEPSAATLAAALGTATLTGTRNFNDPAGPISFTSVNVNVTKPFTGQAPSTACSPATGTTCSGVTWSPADNPFKDGVAYTVSVTLTPVGGNDFNALASATINGSPATFAPGAGGTVVLSGVFTATAATASSVPALDPATLALLALAVFGLAGWSRLRRA